MMDETNTSKRVIAKHKKAMTLKNEDITSTSQNAVILRQIRRNDSRRDKLIITEPNNVAGAGIVDNIFRAGEGDDLDWLGYFIGRSETLKKLAVGSLPTTANAEREALLKGINSNRSVDEFLLSDHPDFDVNLLAAFFSINHKLKCLSIENSNLGDDGVAVLAKALTNQPQLHQLSLAGNNIGTNGCLALCSQLSCADGWASLELRDLNLGNNAIDDAGLMALVDYLSCSASIKKLTLSDNSSITVAGLRHLSTILLPSDKCRLQQLELLTMHIGDEEAETLADGLRSNTSLTHLVFTPHEEDFTDAGWDAFSKLLCDSSSVNDIYFSNHTLRNLGQNLIYLDVLDDGSPIFLLGREKIPLDVLCMLDLNESIMELRETSEDARSSYKDLCAMLKVLMEDDELNVEPLFSYELKLLPLMAQWFRRTRCCREFLDESLETFESRELSTMFKFVQSMPLLLANAYFAKDQARKRLFADMCSFSCVESKPSSEAWARKKGRY